MIEFTTCPSKALLGWGRLTCSDGMWICSSIGSSVGSSRTVENIFLSAMAISLSELKPAMSAASARHQYLSDSTKKWRELGIESYQRIFDITHGHEVRLHYLLFGAVLSRLNL